MTSIRSAPIPLGAGDSWRVTRRELVAYFAIAFAITWGGLLVYLWSLGFAFDSIGIAEALVMLAFMLAGPACAGLGLTAARGGRRGLRDLLGRYTHVGVGWRWYALALLPTPLLLLAILLPMSAWVSDDFRPVFLPFGVAAGLLAGAFEEIGWTGFATPRLLSRHAPLVAGLILGLVWATWHALADYAGNVGAMGVGDWAVWMIAYWIVPLTGYRMLMTWAYSHHRSIALAVLMHASWTGWLAALTMDMPAGTGIEALAWSLPLAAGVWLIVALVALRSRSARQRAPAPVAA